MSLRAVKQILETKPTIEGARRQIAARRWFRQDKGSSIRSCYWTISATRIRRITLPDFPGIPTGASRPSPMSLPAKLPTATAWATRAR